MIWKSFSEDAQKEHLTKFGKNFYAKEQRVFKQKDLERQGVMRADIRKLFGGLQGFFLACGLPTNQRKIRMSDDELREHLKAIKMVDPNNSICPSRKMLGAVCSTGCSCWIPVANYVAKGNIKPTIYYMGKTRRLSRVSYFLWNGPLVDGLVIGHECDNPSCFNPEHLVLITSKKNTKDAVIRGRHQSGKGTKKKIQHNIKDPYNNMEILDYAHRRSTKTSSDEWLFNGKIPRDGYPRIKINKRTYCLPRLILANKLNKNYEDIIITRHVISDGKEAQRHDINPEHLIEGTMQDNANDRRKKWFLSEENILWIQRELCRTPFTKPGDATAFDFKISQKFNVATAVIREIRLGKAYKVYGGKAHKGLGSGKPVVQLDKNFHHMDTYDSGTYAARKLGTSQSSISKACRNKAFYRGFYWMFKSEWELCRSLYDGIDGGHRPDANFSTS